MKNRYIIKRDDLTIGEANSISDIAKVISCSRRHLYNQQSIYNFSYQGNKYYIIDKVAYYFKQLDNLFLN